MIDFAQAFIRMGLPLKTLRKRSGRVRSKKLTLLGILLGILFAAAVGAGLYLLNMQHRF